MFECHTSFEEPAATIKFWTNRIVRNGWHSTRKDVKYSALEKEIQNSIKLEVATLYLAASFLQ